MSYSGFCCKISIALLEKSQQYTNKFGSLLYKSKGKIVFPTPQPISNTLFPSPINSLLLIELSGKTVAALSSFFSVLGASSGNSVKSQWRSLKNL